MVYGRLFIRIIFLLLTSFISFTSAAQDTLLPVALDNNSPKAGKSYASFGLALNEFRSVDLVFVTGAGLNRFGERVEVFQESIFPLTAQTYGAAVTLGTYITDYFKTEVRFGKGIRKDTLEKALDVNLNYWFNWYIGATYPVTSYMSAYALYGVSFYDADVTRYEIAKTYFSDFGAGSQVIVQPSTLDMEEDLFGTKFSQSWLLGLDFHLVGQWFLAFEYGRLLKDDDSNIKIYQAGSYLRYEF